MSGRLASVLLLAGSASAAVVALSGLGQTAQQPGSSGCLQAYNAPIAGCTVGDFTSKACSPQCLQGVASSQTNIQASCAAADVGGNAILSQALQGSLVIVLCGGARAESTTFASTSASASLQTTSSPELTPATSSSSTSSVSTSSEKSPSPTESVTSASVEATSEVQDSTSSTATATESEGPRRILGGGSPFDVDRAATAAAPRTKGQVRLAIVGCAVAASSLLG
ncbi:hypothetical protein XA68_14812 [Ophiocordyceps unilateralis]|uniref:Extracellular membrane protein CFEM domain-containing protein n=1 Tax=Ophiocordyceps unilateralis TaxID=268505 RepID=A0A2A9P9Q7_OPHUN|nr:hypothetical protein XA68_14812 [Ophiocordyceps unilateralis]